MPKKPRTPQGNPKGKSASHTQTDRGQSSTNDLAAQTRSSGNQQPSVSAYPPLTWSQRKRLNRQAAKRQAADQAQEEEAAFGSPTREPAQVSRKKAGKQPAAGLQLDQQESASGSKPEDESAVPHKINIYFQVPFKAHESSQVSVVIRDAGNEICGEEMVFQLNEMPNIDKHLSRLPARRIVACFRYRVGIAVGPMVERQDLMICMKVLLRLGCEYQFGFKAEISDHADAEDIEDIQCAIYAKLIKSFSDLAKETHNWTPDLDRNDGTWHEADDFEVFTLTPGKSGAPRAESAQGSNRSSPHGSQQLSRSSDPWDTHGCYTEPDSKTSLWHEPDLEDKILQSEAMSAAEKPLFFMTGVHVPFGFSRLGMSTWVHDRHDKPVCERSYVPIRHLNILHRYLHARCPYATTVLTYFMLHRDLNSENQRDDIRDYMRALLRFPKGFQFGFLCELPHDNCDDDHDHVECEETTSKTNLGLTRMFRELAWKESGWRSTAGADGVFWGEGPDRLVVSFPDRPDVTPATADYKAAAENNDISSDQPSGPAASA